MLEQKGKVLMKKRSRFITVFACLLAIVSISLVARAQPMAQQRRRAPAKSTVKYHWSQQAPLVVRAMFLAETTLFLAGTPVSARPSLDRPDSGSDQTDALAAFEADSPNEKEYIWESQANKCAVLYVVSTADGKKLAEYKLDSPPVFDGMAAANGRLYLVSNDGKILCFGANQ